MTNTEVPCAYSIGKNLEENTQGLIRNQTLCT